jgi:hypothetical protein
MASNEVYGKALDLNSWSSFRYIFLSQTFFFQKCNFLTL